MREVGWKRWKGKGGVEGRVERQGRGGEGGEETGSGEDVRMEGKWKGFAREGGRGKGGMEVVLEGRVEWK